MRTTPAISAEVSRPSTVSPQVPSSVSSPNRARPTSAIAAVRFFGAAGDAAGSKVRLTRVSTSAAAAGAASIRSPRMARAARGALGSIAAVTWSARVVPGSGAVSMITVTHRSIGM